MRAHHLSARWTRDEDSVLRQVYPEGGSIGAQARLPHRSLNAIRVRAHLLGISVNEDSPANRSRRGESGDWDISEAELERRKEAIRSTWGPERYKGFADDVE